MQKRWVLALNVVVLMIVVVSIVFFVMRFSVGDESVVDDSCVQVHTLANYVYDSCYDNVTKNLYIEVKRGSDIYKLRKIAFNFFDYSNKSYEAEEVPEIGSSQSYIISAEKNPKNIDVYLGVVKDFSSPICSEPRKIFVKDCPTTPQGDEIEVTFNPLTNKTISEDSVSIGSQGSPKSDVLSPNLVDKEMVWESVCKSIWDCTAWGECENGIERRDCVDRSSCAVPTNLPETVRTCDGSCVEDWECTWSECRSGYTVPSCKDLNSCGTTYDLPQKLECDSGSSCIPDVQCSVWSECEVDYNFMDLVNKDIQDLTGIKSRTCTDLNGCSEVVEETRQCSVRVDIYTRSFTKCGTEYLGIYNRVTNEIIARIDKNTDVAEPYINVYLDAGEEDSYCDYCYNGIQDGDETDVDCGGSCKACSEKYDSVDYSSSSFMARVFERIKRIFS